MKPTSELTGGRARIAAGVEESLDALIAAAVEAIWSQVPAYHSSPDPQLRADVTAHVASIFRVFLAGLTTGKPVRRSDFTMTRDHASHRVAQGISLADFLKAFRIGQLTLWQGVLDAARDDEQARGAALLLVAQIMQVIELGSTVAGEAYVEAQQHRLAERDRVRRDLVEDLLARRTSFAGRKLSILRAAGLGADSRLLVASAAVAEGSADQPRLTAAAGAIARSGQGGVGGLAALRHDEIIGIVPLRAGGAEAAVAGLHRAWAGEGSDGIQLAIGVSTIHAGLHEVADAYAEARVARDGLGTSSGVLALPLLSAFDYLVLREGPTAQRLIRPQVRRFVTDDSAAGGALIATLVEYAASDLNAKVAAERLHLHVNTTYYRLERIAERTGCDLRRLADVVELLIAIRLLGGRPAPQSTS